MMEQMQKPKLIVERKYMFLSDYWIRQFDDGVISCPPICSDSFGLWQKERLIRNAKNDEERSRT